jgi:hypothetical protein
MWPGRKCQLIGLAIVALAVYGDWGLGFPLNLLSFAYSYAGIEYLRIGGERVREAHRYRAMMANYYAQLEQILQERAGPE